MTSYGRSPGDVRRWPDDADARQALEEYFAALPPDPKIVVPSLAADGLDFTGADLSGLQLLGAQFTGANLAGVRLVGAQLGGAWLIDANLRGADLSHSSLRKAQGRGCDAEGLVAVEADFRDTDFEGANLRRADLHGAILADAWLPGVDLRDADLRGCVFGQVGTWASLGAARIAGSRFDGAQGSLSGPADVGAGSSRLIDGAELARWLAGHGAEQIEVREPVSQ